LNTTISGLKDRLLALRGPGKPDRVDVVGRAGEAPLAVTNIDGHLTYVGKTATAWFTLAEQAWDFRTVDDLNTLLTEIATQFSHLRGHRLHLRRTSMPYPIGDWADHMDEDTTHIVPGDEVFWAEKQARTVAHVQAAGCTVGVTLLGVTLLRPEAGQARTPEAAAESLAEQARQIGDMLAYGGMQARPAHELELVWMYTRSVILGLDPPAVTRTQLRDRDDILGIADGVERFREQRWASTTRVMNRTTGQVRHVAVLTIGSMPELDIPEVHHPWLAYAQQVGFPVEVSYRVSIVKAEKSINARTNMLRSQQRDNARHDIDDPLSLGRVIEQAQTRLDEIQTGLPVTALSAHGWFRLAVAGDSEAECLDRVQELKRHYDRYNIVIEHPKDQTRLLAEFIPGEAEADTGYIRRMGLDYLAAALPQVESPVGDETGDFIGFTTGNTTTHRPVFYGPNYAPEKLDRSGVTVVVAEPGGGKSTLLGALAYHAVRRGVIVTLLDPSGPLSALGDIPEMRPYTRVIDLTASTRGMLSPFALIPTPGRAEFPDTPAGEARWRDAVDLARVERRGFVRDIVTMLIPAEFATSQPHIVALRAALRRVPAEAESTLEDVIGQLEIIAEQDSSVDAKDLVGFLGDAAEVPLARQFFGAPDHGAWNTPPLTVITMPGLQIPDMGVDPIYWTVEQSMAVPMLHTAVRLAMRRCYDGNASKRKLVGLDEAYILNGWPSGRAFMARLNRDSRKHNTAVLLASQKPLDILDVENLATSVFVGRCDPKSGILTQARELLGLPADAGYEADIARLSTTPIGRRGAHQDLGYREFIYRDAGDRVQTIRVDLTHLPELLAALNTTPGGTR